MGFAEWIQEDDSLPSPRVVREGVVLFRDLDVRAVVVGVVDVVIPVEPAHIVLPSSLVVVVGVVARCWPKLPRLRLGQVGPVNRLA